MYTTRHSRNWIADLILDRHQETKLQTAAYVVTAGDDFSENGETTAFRTINFNNLPGEITGLFNNEIFQIFNVFSGVQN